MWNSSSLLSHLYVLAINVILKIITRIGSFIAGHPKAALLFRFFGDFRYGVPLFIVILGIYKYRNR